VSFAATTLWVASRVFIIIVVDFVIDSGRKLLDIPLYKPELDSNALTRIEADPRGRPV